MLKLLISDLEKKVGSGDCLAEGQADQPVIIAQMDISMTTIIMIRFSLSRV
jgi:hypothetical protein